jgi:hypothetical protein
MSSRPLDAEALKAGKTRAAAASRTPDSRPGVRSAATLAPSSRAAVVLGEAGLAASDEGGCCIPSDSTGSIGPNHYVQMVNSLVGVYDRATLFPAQPTQTLASFVGAPGGTAVVDPQIQWDGVANRWLYSALAFSPSGTPNSLVFGWSKTASPLAGPGWCTFVLGTGQMLNDFPRLGHDDNYIIIGTNIYDGVSGVFSTARIRIVSKPSLGDTTCALPSVWYFGVDGSDPLRNADGTRAFTPVPANTTQPSANGVILAAHDPSLTPQNRIMQWHLSGGALLADGDVVVGSYDIPANALQPSAYALDTLDGRLTEAVAHADPVAGAMAVWTQHTVAGPGGRSVARWYEVLPFAVTPLRQMGSIQSASDFIFNGAISPSGDGSNAAIFYNRSSASAYPSLAAQVRQSTTLLHAMDSGEINLGMSVAPVQDNSCPLLGYCRWGDFATASPDPVNGSYVWASSQLNGPYNGGRGQWYTRNVALETNPAPGAPAVSTNPTSLNFGTQPVGGAGLGLVTLTNNGPGTLNVTALGLIGGNPGDFGIDSDTCRGYLVAVNSSCEVRLRFSPTTTGARSASLNITDNGTGSPRQVALSGTGVTGPAVSLSPTSLAFGNQPVAATSATQVVTLTNRGGATLNVGAVSLGGANPGDFSKMSDMCSSTAVPPSGTCSITLALTPSLDGARAATLSIPSDAIGAPPSVPLTGNGTAPVFTRVSTQQYFLANNDGSLWVEMDPTLALPFRPAFNGMAIVTGNADLWTANAGYNQDIGVFISAGGTDTIVAWKESGGFAGTYSPNAAFVQGIAPVTAGTLYTVKLKWKTNKPAGGATIFAGAGPIGGKFSPTRLTVQILPAASPNLTTKSSMQQYSLINSTGSDWVEIDPLLGLSVTPTVDSIAILSANVDLWTANSGYNQDVGIFVSPSPNAFPNNLVAWKESGGFAGTFSPNAAFVQTQFAMTAGVTYTLKLRWKANRSASGVTIFAGAGPAGNFSPTRLTAQLIPAGAGLLGSAATVFQYQQTNSNGGTWTDLDAPYLSLTITPSVNSLAVLSGNADLWTANAGYNQDIGITVTGGSSYPTVVGQPEAWKESGGFAGTYSPNAAFVQTVILLQAGVTYTVRLQWKTNLNAPGATIFAGAGPYWGGFSSTRLMAQLLPAP